MPSLSTATVLTTIIGIILISLVTSSLYALAFLALVPLLFVLALDMKGAFLRYCFRLVLPSLAVVLGLHVVSAILFHPESQVFTAVFASAARLIARLTVMALSLFVLVALSEKRSIALDLERLGLPIMYSYIVGMAARSPTLLLGEVSEIVAGYKGRGLWNVGGGRKRLRTLLHLSLIFVRTALQDIESRALTLHTKSYFDRETDRSRLPENWWERSARITIMMIVAASWLWRML